MLLLVWPNLLGMTLEAADGVAAPARQVRTERCRDGVIGVVFRADGVRHVQVSRGRKSLPEPYSTGGSARVGISEALGELHSTGGNTHSRVGPRYAPRSQHREHPGLANLATGVRRTCGFVLVNVTTQLECSRRACDRLDRSTVV